MRPSKQPPVVKNMPSNYEDIPLDNLKSQNNEIYQEAEQASDMNLYKCKKGCNRNFNADSIAKHE